MKPLPRRAALSVRLDIDKAHTLATSEDYRAQIDQGFKRLRFTPELEAEFRRHLAIAHQRSAIISIVMGGIIWTLFFGYDLFRVSGLSGSPMNDPLIQLWLLVRLLVLMVWPFAIFRLRQENRPVRHIIMFTYLSCSIGVAISSAIIGLNGLPGAHSFEAIVIMSAFLPIGLIYYQAMTMAIIAAFVPVVTFTVLNYDAGLGPILRFTLPLICAVPVGATGGYLREYAEREQFLYRNIFHSQATQDPLTGIANRRLFDQHVDEMLNKAREEGKNIIIGLVDIDLFKQFNDTYGHNAGDDAIRLTARLINQRADGEFDMAARLGGEEFGILFYDRSTLQAQAIFKAVMEDLEKCAIAHSSSRTGHLTLSIGTAQGAQYSAKQLLIRADKALYCAKSAGRNRICSDGEELSLPQWSSLSKARD